MEQDNSAAANTFMAITLGRMHVLWTPGISFFKMAWFPSRFGSFKKKKKSKPLSTFYCFLLLFPWEIKVRFSSNKSGFIWKWALYPEVHPFALLNSTACTILCEKRFIYLAPFCSQAPSLLQRDKWEPRCFQKLHHHHHISKYESKLCQEGCGCP